MIAISSEHIGTKLIDRSKTSIDQRWDTGMYLEGGLDQ